MAETMKAGRELDALIAEKVMGWTDAVISNYPFQFYYAPERSSDPYVRTPNFSRDIAAAWQVVEKMRTIPECADTWIELWQARDVFYLSASDAAEEICLTALKAIAGSPFSVHASKAEEKA